MSNHTIHIDSHQAKEEVYKSLLAMDCNGEFEITIKRLPKTRTSKQNRALHKYCSLLAGELNQGGYTVQKVLGEAVERDWDMEAVKSLLWKPIQDAVIGKESTADADRTEYSKVYDYVNRHLGEIFGVPSVPWPAKKEQR